MSSAREFRVTSECELLAFLLGPPIGLSRKQAKDLLKFQAVTVRGKTRVRHDTLLAPGDIVEIAARRQVDDRSLERVGLRIVHIDDAIVVIDKPAGLLSMGSEREKEKTAHRILNEHLKALAKSPRQQVFIVHRLDRETSGLMVFARQRSDSVGAAAKLEGGDQALPRDRGGNALACERNAARQSGGEQIVQGASRREGRRAGDHALSRDEDIR